MIKAPQPKSPQRPLPPAGTHVAILYRIMNLGTRIQDFQGMPKDHPDTLVDLTFELPNERRTFTSLDEHGTEREVEKPLVVSRTFSLSMGPKSSLRPFIEGMLGITFADPEAYAFDLTELIGKACLLTITHRPSKDGTRTFANISGSAPLMKGMEVPEQFNRNYIFDINDSSLDEIDKFPDFIQEKIKVSDEYKKRAGVDEAPF